MKNNNTYLKERDMKEDDINYEKKCNALFYGGCNICIN